MGVEAPPVDTKVPPVTPPTDGVTPPVVPPVVPPADGVTPPPTDTKTDGDGKPKPPETYNLKLADDTLLDSHVTDKIASHAKEQGLSNEEAQSLLTRIESDTMAFRNINVEAWNEQVSKDPDLGGANKAATDKHVVAAKNYLKDIDGLGKFLESTGAGSHPAVVRAFVKIGKALGEDQPPLSGKPGTGDGNKKPTPPENSMFPSAVPTPVS